jgi:hypothetical protein
MMMHEQVHGTRGEVNFYPATLIPGIITNLQLSQHLDITTKPKPPLLTVVSLLTHRIFVCHILYSTFHLIKCCNAVRLDLDNDKPTTRNIQPHIILCQGLQLAPSFLVTLPSLKSKNISAVQSFSWPTTHSSSFSKIEVRLDFSSRRYESASATLIGS